MADATGHPEQKANVEVCVRDCQPEYRAISPKPFTFVVRETRHLLTALVDHKHFKVLILYISYPNAANNISSH